jgi:hypothetical protein
MGWWFGHPKVTEFHHLPHPQVHGKDAGADEEIYLVGVRGAEECKGWNPLWWCGVQVALVGPDISQRQSCAHGPSPQRTEGLQAPTL